MDIQLSDAFSSEREDGLCTLRVIHPRWCKRCVEERTKAIYESYERRLADTGIEERKRTERARRERSYLRGVRDGRIFALGRTLVESEGLRRDMEGEEEMVEEQQLVEGMAELGLGFLEDREYDEREEAVDGGSEVTGDKIDAWFKEEEEYKQGVREGRTLEGMMETHALKETNPEMRRQLLENAVL